MGQYLFGKSIINMVKGGGKEGELLYAFMVSK